MNDSNFGLCLCGCQQTTPIAKKTDKRKDAIKGQHQRFMPGHFARMQGKIGKTVTLRPASTPQHIVEITEKDIENLRECDDNEAARVLDSRLIVLELTTRRSFIEIGLICLEVKNRSLWAKFEEGNGVPFHSWEAYVTQRLGVSGSTAFSAVKVLENTRGVPVEQLKEMPRRNAVRFAQLSSKVQKNPKVIEQAISGSEKEFVESLKKNHPDQHIGKAPALVLGFNPENRAEFDDMVEAAMWVYEVESREEAIMHVVEFFMEGQCEREGYHHNTNKKAYAMAKKRGTAA